MEETTSGSTNYATLSKIFKSEREEEIDLAVEFEENVIARTETLAPKELEDKDYNVAVVLCDATSSDGTLSDIKEGEIMESKQHYSDGFPPSREDNVADHEATSDVLRKRNQGDRTTCRLCGKKFPSMKSLHGHMRQHKRNWRGVSPPPEENTLAPMLIPTQRSSPPAKNISGSNPVPPPFKWSMTGKRGRQGKEATNPMHEEEGKEAINPMHEEEGKEAINPMHEEVGKEATNPMHEEEEGKRATNPMHEEEEGKEATNPMHEEELEEPSLSSASDLLFLASSSSRASTPERQQEDGNSLPYDSRIINNGDDLKISRQADSMDVRAASMNADNIEGLNQSIKKSEMDCNKSEDASSFQSAINKPMEDLETVTVLAPVTHRKQYQCTTCNNAFFSPQALGGHATSHKRGKSNSEERMEEAKQAQAEGSSCQGGLPMKALVAKHHRCNICSMEFPTGQALGGHKRKHRPRPPGAQNSAAISPGSAAKKARRIDLNKPPEPEEEEKI